MYSIFRLSVQICWKVFTGHRKEANRNANIWACSQRHCVNMRMNLRIMNDDSNSISSPSLWMRTNGRLGSLRCTITWMKRETIHATLPILITRSYSDNINQIKRICAKQGHHNIHFKARTSLSVELHNSILDLVSEPIATEPKWLRTFLKYTPRLGSISDCWVAAAIES